MSALPQVIRQRCKTCTRSYDPGELLGGLCPICLDARSDNWVFQLGPAIETCGLKECYECHKPFGPMGAYLHWDVGAQAFSLLCIPCSETAIQKSEQYRGTVFGYAHKVQ